MPAEQPSSSPRPGGVEEASRAELELLGKADSWIGRTALALAARIDAGQMMDSAMASLTKQFEALMDKATSGGRRLDDPIDELRTRRERKLGTG